NKAKIDARGIADLMGKGKFTVESVQDKLAQIEQPKKKVAKVSFREDRVLKIVDESKIPRKYLVIDKTAVKDDLKNGIDVPGAVLETVLV
ncbi:siphovirus Gp157 family protein, partial [Escherichia coli]|uniref:siphovirus Gp157 family protein n=1 Tax=Escherichia coli TaxID=562 RepID=UPI003CFE734B